MTRRRSIHKHAKVATDEEEVERSDAAAGEHHADARVDGPPDHDDEHDDGKRAKDALDCVVLGA